MKSTSPNNAASGVRRPLAPAPSLEDGVDDVGSREETHEVTVEGERAVGDTNGGVGASTPLLTTPADDKASGSINPYGADGGKPPVTPTALGDGWIDPGGGGSGGDGGGGGGGNGGGGGGGGGGAGGACALPLSDAGSG